MSQAFVALPAPLRVHQVDRSPRSVFPDLPSACCPSASVHFARHFERAALPFQPLFKPTDWVDGRLILDSFRLDGHTALVTGASRGLGAAIARALSQAGASVVCNGNSTSPDRTVDEIRAAGGEAAPAIADLAHPSAPEALFEQAASRFGDIDILVNNAGVIRRTPAIDYSEEDWSYVLQVNLTAAFRLSQVAAAKIVSRKTAGKILNVASLLSFQGGITVPAYAAAKGGLAQLTKALANEWASKGINVNAIAPGYMATDNTEPLRRDETRSRQILERIPAGRWGTAEDVAGASICLCSEASQYVHGQIPAIDGGWLGR